ncbi:threonine aldolase family protein [Candidatus Formimonas warabiya]|uniref:Low specificity L-threonine aldolase n=1 Tax=Formimonas warabiya TaxID=1761012 RepID=A0A3G1KX29_FORW1|nr:GntG family PLP-dependent aldolase [Candidatus Formimonas warabiya]ATW27048.1 low specificity L-threonine aldolase [Candidatus Formimonas warabiya]
MSISYGAEGQGESTGNKEVTVIDMRSDTLTTPTKEMRVAMAYAEVGDDVYGEDPTVNALEKSAAALVGKNAALFVPSGTMGNQIAILTHTNRGDEVIVDAGSHIAIFEVGSACMFAGVQLAPVPDLMAGETAEKIKNAFRVPNIHYPTSRLVCLENTFNRGGGTVMLPEEMETAADAAKELGLRVHLDGARIFNAAVASGRDVKEFTCHCDSVQFCLSKGLSAPVGSILAGEKEFIEKARKYRKALGGGMRQAGVLAAAGLMALKMTDQLKEDHANAKILAAGFSRIKGLKVDLEKVQTNMVFLDTTGLTLDGAGFAEALEREGVRSIPVGAQSIRFVLHKEVSQEDVLEAVRRAEKIVTDKYR